ncbi:MAG: hypothetical protein K0R65_298 [Crocinitomicaceae bacterium]|jgi:hypothetical protein|nr:hypothetical protein [Crocinitomicaceae bacterium]
MLKGFNKKNTDKWARELKKSYDDWAAMPDFSSWEKLNEKLNLESDEEKPGTDLQDLPEEHDLADIKRSYSTWEVEFDEQKIWEDVNDSIAFEKIWSDINESLDKNTKVKTDPRLFAVLTIFFVLISFFVNESGALFRQSPPTLKTAAKSESTGTNDTAGKNTVNGLNTENKRNQTVQAESRAANTLIARLSPAEIDKAVNEESKWQPEEQKEQVENKENIGYLKILPLNLSRAADSILYAKPPQKLKARIGFFVAPGIIVINQRDNINKLGTELSAGVFYRNFKNRLPYSLEFGFSVSSNKSSSYYNGEFASGKLSMTSFYAGINLYKKISPEVNVFGGVNFHQVNNLLQERNGVLTGVNGANPALAGFNAGVERTVIGNFKTRLSYNLAFSVQKTPVLTTVNELRLGFLF